MKKNTEYYSKDLSLKFGIPQKKVHKLMVYAMKNLCHIIYAGQDLRIPGFGSVYFNKKHYMNYKNAVKPKTNDTR